MASPAGNSTASSSSTKPSTQSNTPVVCHRHGVGELYVSQTDANPFWRFVRCPRRQVSGCNFFEWVDDEMPAYYLAFVQRLKIQKDSLESRLQCKNLLTEMLYDKLKLRDAELESLKGAKVPGQTKGTNVVRKILISAVVFAAVMFILARLCKNF